MTIGRVLKPPVNKIIVVSITDGEDMSAKVLFLS